MYVFKQIFRTLQVNNSRIPAIINVKFSGYCFHRNSNIWGYFRVCISVTLLTVEVSNFHKRMNINHSKLGLVRRICQWNPCQPLSALWTHYVFEMTILSLRIFIQIALSLTEFHVLFVLLLLNRIYVYLFSHRRSRILFLTRFTKLATHT